MHSWYIKLYKKLEIYQSVSYMCVSNNDRLFLKNLHSSYFSVDAQRELLRMKSLTKINIARPY